MVIQSQPAPAQIIGPGVRHSGNAGSAESLSDLEFQKLLNELTMRINADNQAHEPVPGLDVFMDRPVQPPSMRAFRAPPPSPPEPRRGVSTNLTAAIISLAMAAGTIWMYVSY